MSKHTQDEIWSLGFQTGLREVIEALGLSEKQVIELADKLLCGSLNCQGAELLKMAIIRVVASHVAGVNVGTVQSVERFGILSPFNKSHHKEIRDAWLRSLESETEKIQ